MNITLNPANFITFDAKLDNQRYKVFISLDNKDLYSFKECYIIDIEGKRVLEEENIVNKILDAIEAHWAQLYVFQEEVKVK